MEIWQIVLMVMVIVILLVAASFVLVEAGSIGMVFRFRKFVRILNPGLSFIIPLIEMVEHASTQVHQHELPDEPENIDREHEIPEPGKKLPFRILHSGLHEAVFYVKKTGEELTTFDRNIPTTEWKTVSFLELRPEEQEKLREDSLNAPLTSEVPVVVEWYLEGDEASTRNFVNNVAPEEGRTREMEVRKRIEDMTSRVLQELVGKTTLGHARGNMEYFGLVLKIRLENLVGTIGSSKPWGVKIREAYIKSLSAGHRINTARADAAAAMSNKQTTLRNAEAAAGATKLQADADEYSEIKKGKGEAGRIREMTEVMKDPNAQFVATLDVAETVLPKANVVIMPSDMGVLGGILSLGKTLTTRK